MKFEESNARIRLKQVGGTGGIEDQSREMAQRERIRGGKGSALAGCQRKGAVVPLLLRMRVRCKR